MLIIGRVQILSILLERKDGNLLLKDTVLKMGNIYSSDFKGGNYVGNVWSKNGLSPVIRTFQGGNAQPLIVIKVEIKNVYR